MKRGSITKPTGKAPKSIGAIFLKEVPYKEGWRIEAKWRDPGKHPDPRCKKWFNNWRHAEEFAQRENKKLDALKEKGAGHHTVADAADSFLKECQQRRRMKDSDLGPDSLFLYEREVETIILPKWGGRQLATITKKEIQDWVKELRAGSESKEGYAYRTTTRLLIRLSSILDHGSDCGWLIVNPLRAGKKIKVPGSITQRANIPDRSDLEVIRKYLNEPRPLKNGRMKWSGLRVLAVLGGNCGMSGGEVSGLEWDAIDPDKGEIEVKAARATRAGKKKPKTESRYRTLYLMPRAKQIIEEHAILYKQLHGKCVGAVLRSRDKDHLTPSMVGKWFTELMNECGLVRPGSKPNAHGFRQAKFSFHDLRHWFASYVLRALRGDVKQAQKLLGHKNATMTLDVYGHCLEDPELREKFLRMPDWLNPAVQLDAPIDAPSSVQPVETMQPLALPAPEEPLEFDSGPVVITPVECPIDVPDIAKPFVKPFLTMLANKTPIKEAYRQIIPQVECGPSWGGKENSPHTVALHVLAELDRLKLPTPKELAARFRDERILRLSEQKYQNLDIARIEGCGTATVHRALQSRHKENPNNPLNRKVKLNNHLARKTQPQHKEQLKLL